MCPCQNPRTMQKGQVHYNTCSLSWHRQKSTSSTWVTKFNKTSYKYLLKTQIKMKSTNKKFKASHAFLTGHHWNEIESQLSSNKFYILKVVQVRKI